MLCIKGMCLKDMSIHLLRDWRCICFPNARFPARVKAVTGDSQPNGGGHGDTHGQVSSSDLTFPPCWMQGWGQWQTRQKRNIRARKSKSVQCDRKRCSESMQRNYGRFFVCVLSVIAFLPPLVRTAFLPLLPPLSYSQLSSTVGGGDPLLPRLKLKGYFCGWFPAV